MMTHFMLGTCISFQNERPRFSLVTKILRYVMFPLKYQKIDPYKRL